MIQVISCCLRTEFYIKTSNQTNICDAVCGFIHISIFYNCGTEFWVPFNRLQLEQRIRVDSYVISHLLGLYTDYIRFINLICEISEVVLSGHCAVNGNVPGIVCHLIYLSTNSSMHLFTNVVEILGCSDPNTYAMIATYFTIPRQICVRGACKCL